MMRADGATKPVYQAFRLLSQLRGERIAVRSDHPEAGALAVKDEEFIAVLLWHYGTTHPVLRIELQIGGLMNPCPPTAELFGADPSNGEEAVKTEGADLRQESSPLSQIDAETCSVILNLPADSVRLLRLG
ncbi:MAG: hypothetical protein JNL42_18825 [Anaerolineae bacterium]|nr:hypothetical protein [Anaerolineae bacterium]